MSELNVCKYIAECSKQGVSSPDQIVNQAKLDFAKIETTLREQEKIAAALRPRKLLLTQVLKTFGAEPASKIVRKIIPIIPDSATIDKLNDEQKKIVIKFCDFLELEFSNNRDVTAHSMMAGLDIKVENDYELYTTIKWLGMEKIIRRDSKNPSLFIRGDNWNSRPKSE